MLNYYKKYEVETLVMGYIGFKVPLFLLLSLSVISFMNLQGSFFFFFFLFAKILGKPINLNMS